MQCWKINQWIIILTLHQDFVLLAIRDSSKAYARKYHSFARSRIVFLMHNHNWKKQCKSRPEHQQILRQALLSNCDTSVSFKRVRLKKIIIRLNEKSISLYFLSITLVKYGTDRPYDRKLYKYRILCWWNFFDFQSWILYLLYLKVYYLFNIGQ